MPKLSAAQAKTIEAATPVTTSGFSILPDGFYLASLESVEAKVSGKGNTYWAIAWNNLRDLDGSEVGGKQFTNLNMPSKMKADWKADDPKREEKWANYQTDLKGRIHAFFLAHGYSADSDTDEMLGEDCTLEVGHETQAEGANAGKLRNTVVGWQPVDALGGGAASSASGDDEEF